MGHRATFGATAGPVPAGMRRCLAVEVLHHLCCCCCCWLSTGHCTETILNLILHSYGHSTTGLGPISRGLEVHLELLSIPVPLPGIQTSLPQLGIPGYLLIQAPPWIRCGMVQGSSCEPASPHTNPVRRGLC